MRPRKNRCLWRCFCAGPIALTLLLGAGRAVLGQAADERPAEESDVPPPDVENQFLPGDVPPPIDVKKLAAIKPLADVQLQLRAQAERIPDDQSKILFVGQTPGDLRLHWARMPFRWEAPSLAHKPLYWEDPWLERHGLMWHPYLQPWLCGAKFYLNFPVMPVKLRHLHPHECVWTLGHHRPGTTLCSGGHFNVPSLVTR